MSYQKEKECKFNCGFVVVWKGKSGQPNSTGFFEKNSTVEHTFDRCRDIRNKGIKQNLGAPTTPPAGQAQLPVQNNNQQTAAAGGINLNTVFNVVSENRKTITELKKMVQTLQELVDAQSQQITLILKQTGYPKPEPISKNLEELHNETIAQDIKNVMTGPEDEVIDPMRVQKEDSLEPEFTRGWKPISERFECASCEGDKHNGFENYAGTKLCDTCKEGIDAHNF